jgi:hypothetical protein
MFKQIFIAALLIGAIGAVVTALSVTAQQVLADKVGPNGPPEDQNKQGGLGEFYSKDGRDTYFGGASGKEFGGVRSDIAKSQPGIIGSNTAYYGSGECHGKVPDACI